MECPSSNRRADGPPGAEPVQQRDKGPFPVRLDSPHGTSERLDLQLLVALVEPTTAESRGGPTALSAPSLQALCTLLGSLTDARFA